MPYVLSEERARSMNRKRAILNLKIEIIGSRAIISPPVVLVYKE